jgi:hypothetical protein
VLLFLIVAILLQHHKKTVKEMLTFEAHSLRHKLTIDAPIGRHSPIVIIGSPSLRHRTRRQQINRRRIVIEAKHDRVRLHPAQSGHSHQIIDSVLDRVAQRQLDEGLHLQVVDQTHPERQLLGARVLVTLIQLTGLK